MSEAEKSVAPMTEAEMVRVYDAAKKELALSFSNSLNRGVSPMIKSSMVIAYKAGFADCEAFFQRMNFRDKK